MQIGPVRRALQARWHSATVAVKILRRSDEVGLGDFRTELNVLQKVRHLCSAWVRPLFAFLIVGIAFAERPSTAGEGHYAAVPSATAVASDGPGLPLHDRAVRHVLASCQDHTP